MIVSDDSGCAEVIAGTGGGWIVPEGDDCALAASIRLALTDPVRNRCETAKARERIRATYAAHRICGLLENLYTDVLSRTTQGPALERVT